jgi:DNA primase
VYLSKETIDRIQQSTDIIEVIGDFVSLKKKGTNYWACCPFHHEKSPSFAVNPAKGIFKCFGCGKSGDSITFVMEHEGLAYPEAMKYLARKYSIEIIEDRPPNPEEQQKASERENLYLVMAFASKFFQKQLLEHEDGQALGMSYFKERGFSDQTIRTHELGYSLNEWDALLNAATEAGFSESILEKAGLIVSRENANDSSKRKHYDRFRGRVMFPIHNLSGKVIAFGARMLSNEKTQPKYLNSPETDIYSKSKILYGIYQARNFIRQEDNCYLVEGYTDVLSLVQGGVGNVVASSGTSLTVDQIRLVKRYTENITVLYDGDNAGIKASLRGIDLILEEGLNVRVVLFPDGDDPDSYMRKVGATAFQEFVKKATKDFITFKTELALQDAGADPLKKAGVIRDIVESIARIPDAIKRSVLFRQCSTLLQIEEQVLISEYNKIELKRLKDKKAPNDHTAEEPTFFPSDSYPDYGQENGTSSLDEPGISTEEKLQEAHEWSMLQLLVNYGAETLEGKISLAEYVLSETEEVEGRSEIFKLAVEAMKQELAKGNQITRAFFLEHPEERLRKLAIDFSIEKYSLSPKWESKYFIFIPSFQELIHINAPKTILRYKRVFLKVLIQEARQKLLDVKEPEEMETLLKQLMELQAIYKQINTLLGIVVG